MNWIQVSLRFYPRQANPARASGRGVYRVVCCSHVGNPLKIRVDQRPDMGGPILRMMAEREFKVGSRVDPVKIATNFRRLCSGKNNDRH